VMHQNQRACVFFVRVRDIVPLAIRWIFEHV
jgi:hypothetical protein